MTGGTERGLASGCRSIAGNWSRSAAAGAGSGWSSTWRRTVLHPFGLTSLGAFFRTRHRSWSFWRSWERPGNTGK